MVLQNSTKILNGFIAEQQENVKNSGLREISSISR